MLLKTTNHTFPVTLDMELEDWEDSYELLVGNLRHRPKPCLSISIPMPGTGTIATLNSLDYFSTCSFNQLERKSGTIEMVQGAMKAVCVRFPHVQTFELTDTSHFKDALGFHPLPEMQMLMHGETWYACHLNAVPSSSPTASVVRSWQRMRGLSVVSTPFVEIAAFAEVVKRHGDGILVGDAARLLGSAFFTEENVAKMVDVGGRVGVGRRALHPLSGTSWHVTRESILSFPVAAEWVAEVAEVAGGGEGGRSRQRRMRMPRRYIPMWKHGIFKAGIGV